MRRLPKVNQVRGARIRLHYTWSIGFILITTIVTTQFPEVYPLWQRIIFGLSASLLFLAAISIRQFVIIYMTLSKGIPVRSVTLFVFGGVPQITYEATLPILELLIGTTGLLSSLIVAGFFYFVYLALLTTGGIVVTALAQWLWFITLMMTFFHLIPGFPLDGGRLLTAVLWRAMDDYHRATGIVGWIGWGVGLLFAAGGILMLIITQQRLVGVVLAFIGWVLLSAVSQSRRQAKLRNSLAGISARDIMSRECSPITSQISVGQLIRDCILVTGQRYFVVVDDSKLQGIVTMRHIKAVPKEQRDSTPVGEIMTTTGGLKTAHSNYSAISLLEQMDELRIDQMPVLEEDRVIGIVTKDSIIRLGKTRAELGK